jgi:hypothetical protein
MINFSNEPTLVEKTCDLGNAVTGKSSASPKAKLMTA